VLLFLHARLKEAASDRIPQAELDRWQGLYQANARRNLVLTARLLKVLRVFEEHGIRAVPLKGRCWPKPHMATSPCDRSATSISSCASGTSRK